MSEQIIQPEPKPTDDDEAKKRQAEIKAKGAQLRAEKDALNKQRNEILAEQKKLAAEKKELEEFNRWRSQATTDPDAFLAPVYGKDWRDKLAKSTAGDNTPLAIQQLREEWEAERKARAKADAEAKEAAENAKAEAEKAKAEAEETAYQEYAKDIQTRWIEERKEKYPSLYSAKLAHEVAKKAREVHKATGKIPDEDEIASGLEAELDKILEGVYATKKWSEKLAPKAPPPPVRKSEPPTFEVRRKAISQDMAAGTKPQTKPLTREQKREMFARMPDEEWNKKLASARSLRGTSGGGVEEE